MPRREERDECRLAVAGMMATRMVTQAVGLKEIRTCRESMSERMSE